MKTTINIYAKTKSKFADDPRKAEIILIEAMKLIKSGCSRICFDFMGLELINSAFLQDSIARIALLGEFANVSVKLLHFPETSTDLLIDSIKLIRSKNIVTTDYYESLLQQV